MNTIVKFVCALTLTVLLPFMADAQCYGVKDDGSKYGKNDKDSAACVESLSLYSQDYKQKNYEKAIGEWRKAIINCPRSSMNLYIAGSAMMKHFIKKETDKTKKDAMIDTLLCMYDKRILYFKNECANLGRKGSDILNIKKDPEWAYKVLKQSVEGCGDKSAASPLVYYFKASCHLLGKDKITKEEALSVFDKVSSIVEINLAKKPDDKYYKRAQENITAIFVKCHGIADCESIIGIYEPKYENSKTDTVYLQRVGGLLFRQKCMDSPFFYKVAKRSYEQAPTAKSARFIAKLSLAKKSYSDALKYMKEAQASETEKDQKAQDMLTIAEIQAGMKNFAAAKSSALKAAQLKPSWCLPYLKIAEWIAASASSCGEDPCSKKAAYWVAVDYLNKAKAKGGPCAVNSKIAKYKKYYPSSEDCFFDNIKAGDTYKVGCWINESTKARF